MKKSMIALGVAAAAAVALPLSALAAPQCGGGTCSPTTTDLTTNPLGYTVDGTGKGTVKLNVPSKLTNCHVWIPAYSSSNPAYDLHWTVTRSGKVVNSGTVKSEAGKKVMGEISYKMKQGDLINLRQGQVPSAAMVGDNPSNIYLTVGYCTSYNK